MIGRVKGAAAPAHMMQQAAMPAAEAAGIVAGPASADSSADAAAAAMLASPRHGLHTPRARTTEQQVELAVVGPGDLIGKQQSPVCGSLVS